MWRLLLDEPADGATNMARDEALLLAHGAGSTPPTLRLYGWRPACLSLGRFQRSAEVDRAACAAAGVALVRRPSGGRALLHDDELTYSVVMPTSHALLGDESILSSYRAISAALLCGLQRLGAHAELAPVARRRSGASAACFDSAASYEIVADGRKLVGSAQARRAGVLLQHGAVPLAAHAGRLAALLRAPPADLGQRMVALDAALQRPVAHAAVAAALVAGFEAAWGIALEPGAWSAAELALAAELRATRYTCDEWTCGR